MGDAGQAAATWLLTAGALAALFVRLRGEFDRAETLLALAILAGATRLLDTIIAGNTRTAALFLVLSVVVSLSRRLPRLPRAAALAVTTAAIPFLSQEGAIRPTLFSASYGFLALTPLVYVATIGVVARARRQPEECGAALLALTMWPPLGCSLVPSLALLAPGLTAAIAFARRRPLVAAAPLVLAAIVWNYWLMVQYTAGTIPKDAPVSFAAMVRQQADVHTRAPYVYPFAFPGNLIDAWRKGLPLKYYDALTAEPMRERFELAIDRRADKFLLDGWGAMGSSAAGPFRVVTESATVLVPLQSAPSAYEVVISAAPRGQGDGDLRLSMNGHAVGAARLAPGQVTESRFTVTADVVGRVIRAGYNRMSIVSAGPAPLAVYRLRVAPTS